MTTPQDQPSSDRKTDPRVAGISTLGWVTLSALALSIPIMGILKSASAVAAAALPLAIILGSGVLAVRIWSSGEKLVNRKETDALKARLAQLEERLGNLEMIDSLEAHFAEKHSQSATTGSSTMGPPASSEIHS